MLGLMPSENGSLLLIDNGDWLRSAVWLSLGTDARARAGDPLPNGQADDRRGWWGDSYRPSPLGSRLWLLAREKQLPETLARAEEYAREALQWLLDKKIAESLTVAGTWTARGRLDLDIRIRKPSGETYRYSYLWSAENAV